MESSKSRVRLAIFDMDGLLFDTENLFLRLTKETEKELGYSIPYSLHMESIGRTFDDVKELFRDHFGDGFPFREFFTRTKERVYSHIQREGMPVKEGARELIQALAERNIVLALASSSPRWIVEDNLSAAGMQSSFSIVVCGDEIEQGKPAPDIFFKTAELASVDPKEALVFEDSNNGIRAASAAGMRAVMVPDIKPAEKEVEQMAFRAYSSLLEALEEIDEWMRTAKM